jgi:hypothetical protein
MAGWRRGGSRGRSRRRAGPDCGAGTSRASSRWTIGAPRAGPGGGRPCDVQVVHRACAGAGLGRPALQPDGIGGGRLGGVGGIEPEPGLDIADSQFAGDLQSDRVPDGQEVGLCFRWDGVPEWAREGRLRAHGSETKKLLSKRFKSGCYRSRAYYILWMDGRHDHAQRWAGSFDDAQRRWPRGASSAGRIKTTYEGGYRHALPLANLRLKAARCRRSGARSLRKAMQ